MSRIVSVILILFFVGCGHSSESQAVEAQAHADVKPLSYFWDKALEQLNDNKIKDDYRIFMTGLTYSNTNMSTPMAVFLWHSFYEYLMDQGGYRIIRDPNMGELIRPYFKLPREEVSVDGYLKGYYKATDFGLEIHWLRHILINGHVEGKGVAQIPFESLPDLEYIPEHLSYYEEFFSIYEQGFDYSPDLHVLPHKGAGAYYMEGEPFYAYIQTSFDAYIKIYLIQPDLQVVQLLPSQREQENYLEKFRTYRFPSKEEGFMLNQPGNYIMQISSRPQQFHDHAGYTFRYEETYPTFQDYAHLLVTLKEQGNQIGIPQHAVVSFSVISEDDTR